MVTARALIVEDHELLAQSLALALRAEGLEVELVLGWTDETVLEAVSRFRPDLVLLDLQLEGEIGMSTHLIEPIAQTGADVVMVTGVHDRILLAECVEAGATALVSKSEGFDHLVSVVTATAEGQTCLSAEERSELLAELRAHRHSQAARLEPFERLTPREQAVLAKLIEGRSAESIAEDAVVSLATIRSQIRAVLQKLGVSSQLAAVALAHHADWKPPEESNR